MAFGTKQLPVSVTSSLQPSLQWVVVSGRITACLLLSDRALGASQLQLNRAPSPVPPAVSQVSYKEPSPPDTELVVRSQVVAVRENQNPGLGKAAVEVDVAILLPQMDGSEKLLVQGTGIFKRLGALRAL
eukprot:GHUV01029345.1.p1 GENE.GHUV01029345.1~~GHUV01029345.1.p1  ORF type:complete len:130 (-),score=29.31 GHUV01029345.1:2124-2513(-)